ncbi:MAG: hypothetical protein PHQ23_11510, partial [Candidatus Wallbacteria bacterium]|nr:hypothetical protein [Candidatus Wallbacteria bacterium]
MSSLGGVLFGNTAQSIAPDILNSMSAAAGVGSFSRDMIPWKDVANWTHKLAKNPTDKWMDVIDGAVRGPGHRWLNHHPVDFLKEYLFGEVPGLSVTDYMRHAFCDLITTKGMPLLTQDVHHWLVEMGINHQFLLEWAHVNLFDITIGTITLLDGSRTLVLALTSQLPWNGVETFVMTFGKGALELAGGISTQNPILVASGICNVGAGTVSYYKHIHMPNYSLPGSQGLINGFLGGMGAGAVITAIRVGLAWNETTAAEKALVATETMGISGVLGMLAKITP